MDYSGRDHLTFFVFYLKDHGVFVKVLGRQLIKTDGRAPGSTDCDIIPSVFCFMEMKASG
jgi:hypothetical protein